MSLRIAWIVYGSLQVGSGGNLYDREVIARLDRVGHELEVFELPTPGSWGRALVAGPGRPIGRQLRRVGAWRPDVVVEDELVHPSLALRRGRRSGSYGGAPVVSLVHHLGSSELAAGERTLWARLHRRVERRYLESVDGFVFNSETTGATVVDLLGLSGGGSGGVLPVPSAVATPGGDRLSRPAALGEGAALRDAVARRSHAPGPLRVLFLGNVVPRKRVDSLVAALQAGGEAGDESESLWRLDVVGRLDADPDYSRRLARRLEALGGLGDRVRLHGPVDDEELIERLADSHVLAMPSAWEGFGIVYLEAMRFGLPVVAGRAGAARELVDDGAHGFLVDPDDPEGLARRLATLARGRDRLEQMSIAALEASERWPGWDGCAEVVGDLLERVAHTAAQEAVG